MYITNITTNIHVGVGSRTLKPGEGAEFDDSVVNAAVNGFEQRGWLKIEMVKTAPVEFVSVVDKGIVGKVVRTEPATTPVTTPVITPPDVIIPKPVDDEVRADFSDTTAAVKNAPVSRTNFNRKSKYPHGESESK